MSNITIVFLLLGFILLSLFTVSMINRQQMRARLINQKLGQMKRRAMDLEELSVALETLVESPRIPLLINEEAIDVLKNMVRLAPSNHFFAMQLENARQRLDELADPAKRNTPYRLMESDAAIARSQFALTETAKVIRRRQSAGFLEVAEMEAYIRDLSWANFMVKVTSNVAQGHKAVNRGDVLRAFAFYRKALEIATEGGHKDERQNQIISELGELINGKRKALSPMLMPETHYNPKEGKPSASAYPPSTAKPLNVSG
ncbi:hypothetical protein TDB9533_03543 [Thalassocella blandensis]|nr:hypothetical protein TDB9533_03543 [Thalassocella blandensis]